MRQKYLTRLVSLALAIVMCAACLISCDGKTEKNGSETDDAGKTEYTGENGYVLAINDYKGATCTVSECSWSTFPTTEETGDSLLDATFRRNTKVETLYNTKFDFAVFDETLDGYIQMIGASIMAGEDTYQMIGHFNAKLAPSALMTGYYQNLLDLPYLDFDQEWWPSEYMRNANVGNRLYTAIGNMEEGYYNLFTAIFFNKVLAENYKIDDLYALTREGKWTLDRLIEYSNKAYIDLDGDGMMNPLVDQFGFAVHRSYPTDAWVTAFDVKMTEWDAEGLPSIMPISDHYVEIYEKLNDFYHSTCTLYNTEKTTDNGYSFREGRALFEANRMFFAAGHREMEDDFGILPYPKWNEAQENYRSYSDLDNATAYAIPITTNGVMPANLLEALSYFGYDMILPAYYDKSLKGRTTRDEQSGEMLDIIFDNISYDFVNIFSTYIEDAPNLLLRYSLWEGGTITHEFNIRRRRYDAKIKDLIDALDIESN